MTFSGPDVDHQETTHQMPAGRDAAGPPARSIRSRRSARPARLGFAVSVAVALSLVVIAAVAITHPTDEVGWVATAVLVVAAFVLTLVV